MNIVELLNKKIDTFNFNYYGINDLATNEDVLLLLENDEKIRNFYNSIIFVINSIDDYINYLFIYKYSKFEEICENIIENKKVIFSNIVKFISNIYKTYKIRDLIFYINNNINKIIQVKSHSITYQTLLLSIKYHSGCKDALRYYLENKYFMILDNFEQLKNIISQYDDFCIEILKPKYFEEIKTNRLSEYFNMIKFFLNKDIYKTEINTLIDLIFEYGKELQTLINENNILFYDHNIKEIIKFLKTIKPVYANDFKEYDKKTEELLYKYLQKYGQTIDYKIPLDEMLKPFKDENNDWRLKMLLLTHVKKRGNKYISYFELVGKKTIPLMVDFAYVSNMPHDEYYTISKQQYLSIYDQIMLPLLKYFVCEERVNDFIGMLARLTQYVCKKYNINIDETDFTHDFNIILNMLIELFKAYKMNNSFLVQGINYGTTMFILGVIEKLLREIYISFNPENFIKTDWTLGKLLNVENETMVNIFGVDNVKIFAYYLIKDEQSKIGFNYRNNFAHYINIKPKDMNFGVTLKIIQILLCILNELCLKNEYDNK